MSSPSVVTPSLASGFPQADPQITVNDTISLANTGLLPWKIDEERRAYSSYITTNANVATDTDNIYLCVMQDPTLTLFEPLATVSIQKPTHAKANRRAPKTKDVQDGCKKTFSSWL